MVRKYSTISIETTLAAGINSTQTSLTVAAGTGTTLMGGVTLSSGDTFALAIDPETSSEEIVYVTAVASDTFTIQRAKAGTGSVPDTTGIAHNAGATVQHVFTGNDAQHFEDTVSVALTPSNTATVTNKNLTSATNTFPSSLATLTGTQTLTNKTLTAPEVNNPRLKSPEELTSVSATAATGTINFDANSQSDVYYTTNASGNWTLNVRGDSSTTLSSMLGVGDSITVTFKVTNGATAYYQTAFQIDGSAVTPKWQGGLAPTGGNASSVDVYTFNIVKTAATPTYTVFASQTKFV